MPVTVRNYAPKTVDPGDPINILGKGFAAAAISNVKVFFGTVAALDPTVRNDGHVQARTPGNPPLANGVYGLVLQYDEGGATERVSVGAIQVGPTPPDPLVTSFDPDKVPAAGGALSLFGYHFSGHGAGAPTVIFRSFDPDSGATTDAAGTNAAVTNDTMITVTTPSAQALGLNAANKRVFQIDVKLPDGFAVPTFNGGPEYDL